MKFKHPNPKDVSSFASLQNDGHIPNNAKFYKVNSFIDLVKIVAHLHFSNQNNLLLYRGQKKLYLNQNKQYSFYPSIFRGSNENSSLKPGELKERFDKLDKIKDSLEKVFPQKYLPKSESKTSLFYSIIQHYELASTPFLDLTHSLQVAYSFGCLGNSSKCYVAVFGFPHLIGREILYKSKPNIVNIPLLFHCPPETLRPHFQEAYSIGLNIPTDSNKDKYSNDWKKNLVAIIEIPVKDEYQLGEEYLQLKEKPDFIRDLKGH